MGRVLRERDLEIFGLLRRFASLEHWRSLVASSGMEKDETDVNRSLYYLSVDKNYGRITQSC